MTKKELKQIENEQRQKRQLRYRFLNALSNFGLDVDAIQRVNKMNGVNTTDQMKKDILKNYPELTENGYLLDVPTNEDELGASNHRVLYAIRMTENSLRGNTHGIFQYHLEEDDIVVDSIRSKMEIINLINFMHRFGYKRIVFTDRSTNCLGALSDLVDFGAEIVGTNRYIQYGYNTGLIISIEKVCLGDCIDRMCRDETDFLIKKNAEWGRPTKQQDIDAIQKKYNSLLSVVK